MQQGMERYFIMQFTCYRNHMTDAVIGIDSSTTSTKAIAWNASGKIIAEGSIPIPMSTPQLNHYEQDPDDWWYSCAGALKKVTKQINNNRIKASQFKSTRDFCRSG